MMKSTNIELQSEADTWKFGRQLAELLPTGTVIALNGTLGAGKTRLVQAVASACGVPVEDVTSPTFTLWQTYQGTQTIHHLDAYRIGDEDEFLNLGVEECFEDGFMFIEWAERVAECLPPNCLEIRLEVVGETQRTAEVSTQSGELISIVEAIHRAATGSQLGS